MKYSIAQQMLHKQFLEKGPITELFINKILKNSKNINLEKHDHIFISGLARSGTTAFLQAIDTTNQFGSLRYKYMPFILNPKLAGFYARNFVKNNDPELLRSHADRLTISSRAPECLDEPFWIGSLYGKLNFKEYLYPHDIDASLVKSYVYLLKSYSSLESKKRMVIKNNNQHLRIISLANNMPNSKFLVLFRSPIAHSNSLLEMHKRFTMLQKKDKFILDYMNLVGHWEFGLGKKKFIYDKNVQLRILEKIDEFSIEYWLQQWIYTYKWILKTIKLSKLKNIRLVSYEDLCLDSSYREEIFKFLSISNKQNKFKFKISNRKNFDFQNNAIREKTLLATNIYEKLKSF